MDHLEEVLKINGVPGLYSKIKIIRRKAESIQNSSVERVELVDQTTEVIFGQGSLGVYVNSFDIFFDVLGEPVPVPVMLGLLHFGFENFPSWMSATDRVKQLSIQ